MTIDFSEFLEALDDSPFEEEPVDLDTFLGPQFLNQPPLSPIQRDMVEAMSQIYNVEDLERLYGREKGREFYKKYTKNEVVLALGKGSGKDYTSTIGTAYLVYKLLCLRDPAKYFGKPPGDAIDLINIAINAEQAKNVFFKRFKDLVKRCPWFQGKYNPTQIAVEFSKNITVYSGHSERESHEGLNLILAILDEISGFAQTSNTGNEQAKTSDAIYKMFRASVDSRFDKIGKVILLSFPRYKGDFISERYEKVVREKKTYEYEHTFKINDELPDGTDGNTFKIRWEEDEVISYNIDGVFALKAPSWKVNPTKTIESYKRNFLEDPGDALQRFACMGQSYTDAFIKNPDALKDAMIIRNPVDGFMRVDEAWQPNPNFKYFLHADLAQKQDRAAVAVAHVNKWTKTGQFMDYEQIVPEVVVDMVAYWEPKPGKPIDLKQIRKWIIGLRRRGVNIGMVTFDRWNSLDTQMELNTLGVNTETLSVALKHYDDLAMLVYERRVKMPAEDILWDELSNLRIVSNTQVDHPRKGSKDLADAVTGAVYNAITRTPKDIGREVDIHDHDDVRLLAMGVGGNDDNTKKPPMPSEIEEYLISIKAL